MLRVLVQTHPDRREAAARLATRFNARIILDPAPYDAANPWRCYQQCIAEANPYEWNLILQDDALPSEDLLAVCDRIIAAHPRELVCLYHGRHPQNNAVRMMMARDRGLAYAECRATRYVPSVALLWPPHMISRLKDWVPRHPVAADDEMISSFLTHTGHHADTYLVTVPSLVDHDDTSQSLMGTQRDRPAVLPPNGDVAGADWAGSILPYLSGRMSRPRGV